MGGHKMFEIPETITIAKQINDTVKGKKILKVIADSSPHKFAWYYKDPQKYGDLLVGKVIDSATAYANMVEIKAGSAIILLGDGIALRYIKEDERPPLKHQLLLALDDLSTITVSIQMYGGIWCFDIVDDFNNIYYKMAKEKISPLTDQFDMLYFCELINSIDVQKLSVKALLATEQRIPGLGNGVLQDILWNAKIHPKRKVNSLTAEDKEVLFKSMKKVLSEMVESGGRDTEKDLFGNAGGYKTNMSKNNMGKACRACGGIIHKESYLGGSIYYCEKCQSI
jgi:formamidopyrimidine-DNA glycosylase